MIYKLPISSHNSKYQNKYVLVDKDIYEVLKDNHLHCTRMGGKLYIRVYQGHCISSVDINDYILTYTKYKQIVKYKDDFFDRRRSNLYIVDNYKSDYSKNTTKKYGNLYKGVSYNKHICKYVCFTFFNKKSIYFGQGDDPKELAKLYDAYMFTFFKDKNPYLNFPDELDISLVKTETKHRIQNRLKTIN